MITMFENLSAKSTLLELGRRQFVPIYIGCFTGSFIWRMQMRILTHGNALFPNEKVDRIGRMNEFYKWHLF